MGLKKYTNITIRGKVYRDAHHAAAALGVKAETVRLAIRKDRLHMVGTGASHPPPMPCHVGGKSFPSIKAAATHFGVSYGCVWKAMEEGREDRVGKPQRQGIPARSKKIAFGPFEWPSLRAADRDLGFVPGYIGNVIRLNRKRGKDRIYAAVMRKAASDQAPISSGRAIVARV